MDENCLKRSRKDLVVGNPNWEPVPKEFPFPAVPDVKGVLVPSDPEAGFS